MQCAASRIASPEKIPPRCLFRNTTLTAAVSHFTSEDLQASKPDSSLGYALRWNGNGTKTVRLSFPCLVVLGDSCDAMGCDGMRFTFCVLRGSYPSLGLVIRSFVNFFSHFISSHFNSEPAVSPAAPAQAGPAPGAARSFRIPLVGADTET
mmetsp:Transcript_20992/g.49532  ORF Transcript_20992/g.49532 Transcript_20992/m.49532 type:complete len:151 (-) Transcript_20992:125-577(-)